MSENLYKRIEQIKQEMTVPKYHILIDAYIQSEQSRYMNMGHNPGKAVEMAVTHLDDILRREK
jgi:hypothetical protein